MVLEVFLRHLSYCRVKAFHEGYDRKLMNSQILNAVTILSLNSTSSDILLLTLFQKTLLKELELPSKLYCSLNLPFLVQFISVCNSSE